MLARYDYQIKYLITPTPARTFETARAGGVIVMIDHLYFSPMNLHMRTALTASMVAFQWQVPQFLELDRIGLEY